MSTEIVSFRIDPETLIELRDAANRHGVTVSDLIRHGAARIIEAHRHPTMTFTWTTPINVTVGNPPTADDEDVVEMRPGIDYGPVSKADLDGIYAAVDGKWPKNIDFAEVEDDDEPLPPDALQARVAELERQRDAVLALHAQGEAHCPACEKPICLECGDDEVWPCPTIQALDWQVPQ